MIIRGLILALCFVLVSVSAFAGPDIATDIRNLETVRDSYKIPSVEIITQLDKLYAEQIDLIATAILAKGGTQ